jgi:peptidyl-prolyl cis-trans isomerase B (cyclophilin B)
LWNLIVTQLCLMMISIAGASPAFELDGENIAFGELLEGSEVLSEIAAVPTIKPSETLQTYNALASFIGDDRAARARQSWGKPLQAIVITGSGTL